MNTSPESVAQAPQTEETQKGTSPPSQFHVNIGQGGPDGDDEDDGLEEPLCRICYEGEKAGKLLSLCHCKGSMGCTHLRCLERWLDAAQKTRCELCGFSYRVQLTRRYSVLPSVRVWIREQADKRLLVIDLLTVICVMPVIGAYVYFSVRGILELAKGPVGIGPNETTTEALTAIGLLVMCAIIVICFFIWLGIAVSGHFSEWYSWWSSCYRISVLPTPVDEDQVTAVARGSSLEQIFPRGAHIQQHASV